MSGCRSNDLLDGRIVSDGLPDEMDIQKDYAVNADYPIPSNLSQLEDEVSHIVYVKMAENIEIGGWNKDDYTTTLTQVQVLDVFKGEAVVDQILYISESYFLTEGKLETIEGYVPMEKDEDYLLFLADAHSDPDLKLVYSMGFGKYHFDKLATDRALQSFDTLGQIKDFGLTHEGLADLYNSIHKEIVDKYSQ